MSRKSQAPLSLTLFKTECESTFFTLSYAIITKTTGSQHETDNCWVETIPKHEQKLVPLSLLTWKACVQKVPQLCLHGFFKIIKMSSYIFLWYFFVKKKRFWSQISILSQFTKCLCCLFKSHRGKRAFFSLCVFAHYNKRFFLHPPLDPSSDFNVWKSPRIKYNKNSAMKLGWMESTHSRINLSGFILPTTQSNHQTTCILQKHGFCKNPLFKKFINVLIYQDKIRNDACARLMVITIMRLI